MYGTLRPGLNRPEGGAGLLPMDRHRGQAVLAGRLYMVSWYPGLVETETGEDVVGNLFWVGDDKDLLAALDRYEGCAPDSPPPHEYSREIRQARTDAGLVPVWVYIFRASTQGLTRIESGDFADVDL